MALLITLLIVALSVTAVLEVDRIIRTDVRATRNFRDGIIAVALARSGIAAGRATLKDDSRRRSTYDGLDEPWATPSLCLPVGEGTVCGTIEDEERKININALGGKGRQVGESRKQLVRLFLSDKINIEPGLAASLIDAIKDFIDSDDDPELNGTEDGAKNAPLDDLTELLWTKGMTKEVFEKIRPYLTAYPNKGQELIASKVNINTADPLVLASLDERVNQGVIERILANRPFKDTRTEVLESIVGSRDVLNTISPSLTVKSQFFTITSSGEVNGFKKTARMTVRRDGEKITPLAFRIE